jgi:RecB family endonuclease NucS
MPFYLYADCIVEYDGRAKSELIRGNYILLHKSDGTLIIHGNSLVTPLNYQSCKAVMRKEGNILISERKGETIKVTIYGIIDYHELNEWSNNKICIEKTEDDLRNKFLSKMNDYFHNVSEVHKEYGTPYGPIDAMIISDGVHCIIEVKRKKITINHCTQLEKYIKYFQEIKQLYSGYIVGPDITKNAVNYAEKNDITIILMDFD